MGDRLDLQTLLEGVLGSDNVYFQPPEAFRMVYPCIVYHRSRIRTDYADNNPYNLKKEYTIIVVDSNPDSVIPDAVAMLPTAAHNRRYVADKLNHDVFSIFY